jgi:hypothetical protein
MMSVLAQIPLSPSLRTRLIALLVIEVVLAVVVVASWLKYRQLKHVSIDEWFAERDRHASARVRRMMQESHEQWEAERRAAEAAERRAADEAEPQTDDEAERHAP